MGPKDCSLAYDLSGVSSVSHDELFQPELVVLESDKKHLQGFSFGTTTQPNVVRIQGKVTVSF